jgi:hypothetical protein
MLFCASDGGGIKCPCAACGAFAGFEAPPVFAVAVLGAFVSL